MTKYTAFFVVLFSAAAAFSEPSFNLAVNIGGTASSVEATKIDSNLFYIVVDDSKWKGFFCFGLSGEFNLNEYFGIGLGVSYEKRGGILQGGIWMGNIRLATGEFEFDYRYLQMPLYAKITIPLMIPGSVYCSAGPELGIKLESEYTIRSTSVAINGYPKTEKIDTLTQPLDFGLSGTLGYDIPIGWLCGIRLFGTFYYGFIDVYKKDNPANSDMNLYHRAFKYGISFYMNLNAARR